MQYTQPQTIKDKIMCEILPAFNASVVKWSTVEEIQKYTRIAVEKLLDVTQLDLKAKEREPQSDKEH